MTYVQPSDLLTLFPQADPEAVAKWIDKAERRLAGLLARRSADLEVLAADPARLPLIADAIENAVMRVLRNPDGLRSESEGDYSYTANPLDASGNIWFPAEDLDLIAPRRSSSVGTIRLGLPAHRLVW